MKRIYFGCLLALSLLTFTLAASAQCQNLGCTRPGSTDPGSCYSCDNSTGYNCGVSNCKSCLASVCQGVGDCDPSVDFSCDPLITDARPAIPEFQNAPRLELKHSVFPNSFFALSKPRQFECKPPTLPTNVLFTL